jgi:hypothetical protein
VAKILAGTMGIVRSRDPTIDSQILDAAQQNNTLLKIINPLDSFEIVADALVNSRYIGDEGDDSDFMKACDDRMMHVQ